MRPLDLAQAVFQEGAVLYLEKLSRALEHIDSSSGAIGTSVNNAITALVPIISDAPADAKARDVWLERLWDAHQEDAMPYIELLGNHWGELCASKEVASRWADQLMGTCKIAWSPNPNLRGVFNGTTNCLSALLTAERSQETLELLETAPYHMWHYRQYGVKALAALGKKAEAIRYAEEAGGLSDSPIAIARVCEEVLLSSGLVDEPRSRYALEANRASTHFAWFRAVARKYPHKEPRHTPHGTAAQSPWKVESGRPPRSEDPRGEPGLPVERGIASEGLE